MIEIKIYGADENKVFPKHIEHYKSTTVPRVGEYVSIQYWEAEVYKVVWDIFQGRVEADVYIDVSEIVEHINFN